MLLILYWIPELMLTCVLFSQYPVPYPVLIMEFWTNRLRVDERLATRPLVSDNSKCSLSWHLEPGSWMAINGYHLLHPGTGNHKGLIYRARPRMPKNKDASQLEFSLPELKHRWVFITRAQPWTLSMVFLPLLYRMTSEHLLNLSA